MWLPSDATEIERAATNGELEETPSFDAKACLPQAKKNASLAVDVAAMSTDGGSLVYGIGEDEHGRPTVLAPIQLKGAAERVDQIVSTSIDEVPYIDVREFPCPDDIERGYLVILIPASPRAPHQVTVGRDLRFYGRGAKGNRILNEGDVARLYARRETWRVDREKILADVVANAPLPPIPLAGYLHGFVRPVAPDEEMLESVVEGFASRHDLHQWLLKIVSSTRLAGDFSPGLHLAGSFTREGADMWRLSSVEPERRPELLDKPKRFVDFDFNFDGRGHLFCGRATDRISREESPARYAFERLIAGNLEAFLALMAALYEKAGYHGAVDVGVALTGINGAMSYSNFQDMRADSKPYPASAVTRTARIAAAQLRQADEVVLNLLGRFFAAITGWDEWSPYSDLDGAG